MVLRNARQLRHGLTAWLLIAVLIAVTRLPVLLSPTMALDGDECVLGLMSKHLLEKGEVPVFFWGQRYGLSTIEAGVGAAFFRVFGIGDESMRLAMLFIWSWGVFFFAKAAARLGRTHAYWYAVILIVFCPSWSIWSTKARGGYLTAFLFAGATIWVLSLVVTSRCPSSWASGALGAVFVLAGWSQPTWLPAVMPFVIFYLWRFRRSARTLCAVTIGGMVPVLVLLWAARSSSGYWRPNPFEDHSLFYGWLELPSRLRVALGGNFHYTVELPAGPFTRAGSLLWSAIAALAVVVSPTDLRHRKAIPVSLAASAGMVATACATIFMGGITFGYRHLLPVPLLGAFIVAVLLSRAALSPAWRRGFAGAGLALVAVIGIGATTELSRMNLHNTGWCRVPAKGTGQALSEELLRQGIQYVYCPYPMYQWNIVFDSRERIIARSRTFEDRWPPYGRTVDQALHSGRRVGLVGWREDWTIRRSCFHLRGISCDSSRVGKYFVVVRNPPLPLLEDLQFRFSAGPGAPPARLPANAQESDPGSPVVSPAVESPGDISLGDASRLPHAHAGAMVPALAVTQEAGHATGWSPASTCTVGS